MVDGAVSSTSCSKVSRVDEGHILRVLSFAGGSPRLACQPGARAGFFAGTATSHPTTIETAQAGKRGAPSPPRALAGRYAKGMRGAYQCTWGVRPSCTTPRVRVKKRAPRPCHSRAPSSRLFDCLAPPLNHNSIITP